MNVDDERCEHRCRDTCAMLNNALHQETVLVRFYESAITQCDEVEMRSFLRGLAEERSAGIIRIMQKLNEVKARSQILDGINSSFHK
jgi:hypothetical protein